MFLQNNFDVIKWNNNIFSLQFLKSTKLSLMCVCHFGFVVRYNNMRKKIILQKKKCINRKS